MGNLSNYLYNRNLPKCVLQDDRSNDFLVRRFIDAICDGGLGENMLEETSKILTLFNPRTMEDKYLPYYARKVGYRWDYDLPIEFQRIVLINWSYIIKRKGTIQLIYYLFRELAFNDVEVTKEENYPVLDEHQAIVGYRTKLEVEIKVNKDESNFFDTVSTEKFEQFIKQFLPIYCDIKIIFTVYYKSDVLIDASYSYKDTIIEQGHVYDTKVAYTEKYEIIGSPNYDEVVPVVTTDTNPTTNELTVTNHDLYTGIVVHKDTLVKKK